jgi:hypothetical protein
VPGLQEQLQTALILSVTFIWSYQWVGLNVLWLCFSVMRQSCSKCRVTRFHINRAPVCPAWAGNSPCRVTRLAG